MRLLSASAGSSAAAAAWPAPEVILAPYAGAPPQLRLDAASSGDRSTAPPQLRLNAFASAAAQGAESTRQAVTLKPATRKREVRVGSPPLRELHLAYSPLDPRARMTQLEDRAPIQRPDLQVRQSWECQCCGRENAWARCRCSECDASSDFF